MLASHIAQDPAHYAGLYLIDPRGRLHACYDAPVPGAAGGRVRPRAAGPIRVRRATRAPLSAPRAARRTTRPVID
jgi:hypothetical protein